MKEFVIETNEDLMEAIDYLYIELYVRGIKVPRTLNFQLSSECNEEMLWDDFNELIEIYNQNVFPIN